MEYSDRSSCTAFSGMKRFSSGTLVEVARAARETFDRDGNASILVFDDVTGEQLDLDLSGGDAELMERRAHSGHAGGAATGDAVPSAAAPRGPGRPRLGVVAREVTLLPRHWEWLNSQPGGASVALRKLVEQARKTNEGRDRRRRAQEATYRFMAAVTGNLAGFEEAIRALFAADRPRFDEIVESWPPDVRDYATRLAAGALADAE
jgi:hypothetical protein